MLNIIILVIGILAIISGAVLLINVMTGDMKLKKSVLAVLLVFGLGCIIFSQSFVMIETGYTGVKKQFGQISEEVAPNGFNWKTPFIQTIEKVNNKQQDIAFEKQIWSETANRTAIYFENVTVTYQINPSKSAWIYANVTNYKDNLVTEQLVASALKAASKTLKDEDATNRSKIEQLAMENVQESLNQKYKGEVVTVNKVVIADADFDDSYKNAIAEKQKAQLEAEKQQIVNEKNIAEAEADKKVKIANAEAAAEAERIKAEGTAEANKTIADSLTDDLQKYEMIQRWNGMPSLGSGDSMFMVDIDSLLSKESQ
ncbi:MAG: SPFH domain-containing protein [Lachnospiraceae bacterium]|nr:SPFH domain-containing protein [Lachnospiraceae bacterium]